MFFLHFLWNTQMETWHNFIQAIDTFKSLRGRGFEFGSQHPCWALTTPCNSSPRGFNDSLLPLQACHPCVHNPIHVYRLIILNTSLKSSLVHHTFLSSEHGAEAFIAIDCIWHPYHLWHSLKVWTEKCALILFLFSDGNQRISLC